VSYHHLDERIEITAQTPTETKIVLPDGQTFEVSKGTHRYSMNKQY